ncbi:hypothetical protein MC885_014005 [Smutsia gigantea]|nr:hypothetical protein MC885_014005 [Smutsia gigantea]
MKTAATSCIELCSRVVCSKNGCPHNIVTFIVALLVTLSFSSTSASSKGLSLSYIIQLRGLLQVCVRTGAETQAKFTSVDLLREYILTCVPECTHLLKEGTCPHDWPTHGEITFRDYWMRYRDNTPLVLDGLNLNIPSGQTVGIVGRAGSGKSSLGTALFHLVEPVSGAIFIDEVDICTIGLEELRAKLTDSPGSSPVGRHNLDPFENHTDEILRWVLERTFMRATADNETPGKMTGRSHRKWRKLLSGGTSAALCGPSASP